MGILVTSCYTVLIVMLTMEASTSSNLLPPDFDISTLTPQNIADREYGSKIVVVAEQMQIVVIWACKACLLILYHRLTHMVAVKENVAVKLLAVYLVLGFIVMEILYFSTWCRPFSQYWAVPASPRCTTLTNHRITNAVFNISSDLIMLCIALPMFIRSLLPLKRKLILCFIFSLGVFAIIAAVLNKYYSFTKPYEPTWINWYTRESSTAILVANLPFTWTLLRKVFDLGVFDEEHFPSTKYHSSRTAGGRRTARAHQHPHHGMGGGSSARHSGNHSHPSTVNKTGRSMSLVGSMCAAKEGHHQSVNDDSQYSSNRLLDTSPLSAVEAAHFGINTYTRDHANNSSNTSPTAYTDDIDIERSLSPAPSHVSRSVHQISRSPTPSHSYRGTSIDSALHPYPLAFPRRVHVAPGLTRSRASSIASGSTGKSATIALSANILHTGTVIGAPRGMGGGRSAKDRKMRARMST